MQICVISLPRSVRRRKFIDEQIRAFNLPYEFFDAVDGAVEFERYFEACDEHAFLMNTGRVASAGEIGCFASHVALWKRCVLQNRPILVLEDDAYLHTNFPAAVDTACSLIDDYGFIRLQQGWKKRRRLVVRSGRFGVYSFPSFPLGSQCYAISPAAARALLFNSLVFESPVDVFIKRYWEHGQPLFALFPFSVSCSHFSVNPTIQRGDSRRNLPLKARRFFSKSKLAALRAWFHVNQQFRLRRINRSHPSTFMNRQSGVINMIKNIFSLAAIAAPLLLGLSTSTSWAGDEAEVPFTVGKLFFQLNDTDGDLGIHMKVDGEPWKHLSIEDARGRRMLNIRARGRLRRQGLTELAFESAEPTFDELTPAEFFARFPEGVYDIEGITLSGEERENEVTITHVLPAPPVGLAVSGIAAPDDCDEGVVPIVGNPVVLSWDAVTTSHPDIGKPGPVDVTRYELAVEIEGDSTLKLEVDLPPDLTSLEIPPGFINQGEEFKFQVLVTDAGGNETSSESCFEAL